jgi:hypothetical protein
MKNSKPEKIEAFKLFSKGLTPIEVYESLNKCVNQVTVYRWYKLYLKDKECVTLEVDNVLSVVKNNDTDLNYNQDDFDSLLECHIDIRKKTFKHLTTLLNEDVNKIPWRVVATVSNILCKHSELEYKIGSYAYNDINKSVALITNYGYVVIDPGNDEIIEVNEN